MPAILLPLSRAHAEENNMSGASQIANTASGIGIISERPRPVGTAQLEAGPVLGRGGRRLLSKNGAGGDVGDAVFGWTPGVPVQGLGP